MEFFVTIPQITLEKYQTLDITHGAILYFMRQFIGNPSIERHEEEGKWWYWFATQHIIAELPMLRITNKTTIIRKINQIIEEKLLERKVECNKTYYFFTEAFFDIFKNSNTEVLQNCNTRCGENASLGVAKMQHNHNTNINIPKSENIYMREAFNTFWNIYPNAKEEHRSSALAFFAKNNLHVHILQILKATDHYADSEKVKNGFIYNPAKFLESVYPSYVQGNPEQPHVLTPQKFRNETVVLCEKMAWLDEKWGGLEDEAKRAIIQSDGSILTKEGADVFNESEINAINKAGGIETVLYSYLTRSTKEQLERLLA